MATYRVGDEGAVVFNERGEPLARLRPGYVVVEGTLDAAKTRYERHVKRVRGYANKVVHPDEDKR